MQPSHIRTATKVSYASGDIIEISLHFTRAISRKNRNVYSWTMDEKDGEERIVLPYLQHHVDANQYFKGWLLSCESSFRSILFFALDKNAMLYFIFQ